MCILKGMVLSKWKKYIKKSGLEFFNQSSYRLTSSLVITQHFLNQSQPGHFSLGFSWLLRTWGNTETLLSKQSFKEIIWCLPWANISEITTPRKIRPRHLLYNRNTSSLAHLKCIRTVSESALSNPSLSRYFSHQPVEYQRVRYRRRPHSVSFDKNIQLPCPAEKVQAFDCFGRRDRSQWSLRTLSVLNLN